MARIKKICYYNLMIVTCEIDQFICVNGIANKDFNANIAISEYCDPIKEKCKYLPKEIFNMININTINFFSFTKKFPYGRSIPRNHYFCKWNNLVNLKNVHFLHKSLYRICEDGHIQLLNLS